MNMKYVPEGYFFKAFNELLNGDGVEVHRILTENPFYPFVQIEGFQKSVQSFIGGAGNPIITFTPTISVLDNSTDFTQIEETCEIIFNRLHQRVRRDEAQDQDGLEDVMKRDIETIRILSCEVQTQSFQIFSDDPNNRLVSAEFQVVIQYSNKILLDS